MRKMLHKEEEVVYIEYINNIPHQVITAPLSGWGLRTYDFEFIGNDKKDLQYYQSGMGGSRTELHAPHFVKNDNKCGYWIAENCKFKGKSKPKNCIRLDSPIRLTGYINQSINPFKVSWENSYGFEYCKICNAHYGHDEGCREHHEWSDDEGCFIYEDGSRVE